MRFYYTEENHPVKLIGCKPPKTWRPILTTSNVFTKEFIKECEVEYKRVCAERNASIINTIKVTL